MASSKITVIFIFCCFTLLAFHLFICTGSNRLLCIASEQEALLKLKESLTDPSNRLHSWSGNRDCCTWEGVVCDNVTGHVLELHLGSSPPFEECNFLEQVKAYERSRFGGEINPSLLDLKHLNILDLSGNDFGGMAIPSFIGSLSNLTYLNLSEAGFGGKIPHQLGNLSNLLYLDLETSYSTPRFSGKIPHEIGNLSNLIHLNLGCHSCYDEEDILLSVENLQWLSSLSSLKYLDLSSTNLSKASDWLWVTQNLPALNELCLLNCPLDYQNQLSTINFSSLVFLDLSKTNYFQVSFIPKWIFGLGQLISLELEYNYFQGPIPYGIQNITLLESLDLSGNLFNSSIPNWLYKLSHLKSLLLYSNNLHGTISNDIAKLSSIVTLDLSDNKLEGKVPTSLGYLCNLREIYLSFQKCNQDISEILDILSECVSFKLKILWIFDSQLSGHLTDQIGVFKQLVSLGLHNNSIQGELPKSLEKLSSLKYLQIDNNHFHGNPFVIISQLSKLQYLSMDYNRFQGVVTEAHLSNLTCLEALHASENHFTLQVNSNGSLPFQLSQLNLRSWKLGPRFPMWIKSQKYLEYLTMSKTQISDFIPNWFWSSFPHAFFVDLSNNQLYGDLSLSSENPISFPVVELSSNHLRGQLPYLSPLVVAINLAINFFSGSITHFLCQKQKNPKNLEFLSLESNNLSGEIPDCWMFWPNLVTVTMENNSFTGNIPLSLGSLNFLQLLKLNNNKLSGKFPLFLRKSTQLKCLDIENNKISGTIPSWIGELLMNLKILRLRANKFFGQIPLEICTLKFLQVLDLAENNLEGYIPKCLIHLKIMTTKNSSADSSIALKDKNGTSTFVLTEILRMKGIDMEYSTILGLVTSIDLSSNKLSGNIPEEITNLLALHSLNLSNNFLDGQIPESIGNMESLESLDLSRNKFFGEIPPSIASLTFLSKLNLSFNNLRGKIPTGTQLQSFEQSSFIGNNLCGPPLLNNCSKQHVIPGVVNKHKEGNGHGINWFYVSMIFGSVVGFSGFVGPLFLCRSWRHAYFHFIDKMWYKMRFGL